jgi:hypothetical protein
MERAKQIMVELSVTQQKIINLLSDGLPHKFEELQQLMPDDLADRRALSNHLAKIRTRIRPRGEDIICQFILRQRQYRHVRLLHSANDGCR